MKAPVQMMCARCNTLIPKGSLIERLPTGAARYTHVGCSKGRPPVAEPGDSKAGPKIDTPASVPTPKGWVTEDKFALPEDAIKRLRGQGAPTGRDEKPNGKVGKDDRLDDPEIVKGSDGDEGDTGNGESDGDSGEGEAENLYDGNSGEEGEGEEEGSGDSEAKGDGEEEDESEDGDDGSESEEDGSEEGDEEDGKDDQEKAEDKKGEKQKPPAESKRNGKLEDLPDDLLLKLAMLAAQMAEERLRGRIEPRLAKLMAEVAEPLTAKMAGEFQARMGDSVRGQLNKAVADARKETGDVITTLRREIDRRVEEEVKRLDGLRPVVHKIERPDGSMKEFPESELFHFAFDEVLKLAGAGFDVFCPGPTGCGKTHMMGQVAQALGLDFGLVSGTGGVTETELFGNSFPNITTGESVYQATEFVNLYENGGLFLLDEADGMDANCLLKVNAAIANGYCTVPKRLSKPRAVRHKNFIFALAANTWGHGATRMYCGRNKLDEATLDRFRGGTVAMDYDHNIERRLVGDQKLYRTLAGWREAITRHGLPRVLSTRFMCQAVRLKAMGYDDAGIAKKLTGGWSAGEVEKVIGAKV